jgi:hypothetical protein
MQGQFFEPQLILGAVSAFPSSSWHPREEFAVDYPYGPRRRGGLLIRQRAQISLSEFEGDDTGQPAPKLSVLERLIADGSLALPPSTLWERRTFPVLERRRPAMQ